MIYKDIIYYLEKYPFLNYQDIFIWKKKIKFHETYLSGVLLER